MIIILNQVKKMNDFDFKSWYVILAIFIAHIYRHYSLMDKIKESTSELASTLKGTFNLEGLKKKRDAVNGVIYCIEAIMLHLLALMLLCIIFLLVFNFPTDFLKPEDFGSLSAPMLKGEKIIYLIVAGLFFVSYTVKGIIPTISAIRKVITANGKIRELENAQSNPESQ